MLLPALPGAGWPAGPSQPLEIPSGPALAAGLTAAGPVPVPGRRALLRLALAAAAPGV